jgi:hypothetical protein
MSDLDIVAQTIHTQFGLIGLVAFENVQDLLVEQSVRDMIKDIQGR